MSKHIIIGDLHLGAHSDDRYIQNAQLKFFEFVCDYAKKNNITHAIQTGDFFDVRTGSTQETLRFFRTKIHSLLENVFDSIDVIIGNHDCLLKNQIRPNSVYEHLHQYSLYRAIEEPTTISMGSTLWDLIPWECKENKEHIRKFIHESNSEYNLGHWELDGFYFYAGVKSSGDKPEFLEKYKKVVSGHFHTSSKKGNVLYVGTPYTITLGDANDVRGFWIFDDETEEFEFVANPSMWHHKVIYNENFDITKIKNYDGMIVSMIVEKSDKRLEGILTQFEEICYDFRNTYNEELSFESDDKIDKKSLMTIFNEHVDTIDLTEEEKTLIKRIANALHVEATSGE